MEQQTPSRSSKSEPEQLRRLQQKTGYQCPKCHRMVGEWTGPDESPCSCSWEDREIALRAEGYTQGVGKPTWDDTFLELMAVIAKRSDDPITKVGCVIVDKDNTIVSLGYNGAPRGIPNEWVADAPRAEKYDWVEHADRNAIYNAGRIGVVLGGSTMYLPWCPCAACARAIIQSGIVEVVIETDNVRESWLVSCGKALRMMVKAQVLVRLPNGLGAVTELGVVGESLGKQH